MKAIQVNRYGNINDVVTTSDIAKPQITAGSVLVQVEAASINPLDNILRAGYMKEMMPMSFPYVMGSDGAGIITEVGEGVEGLSVGDEVYFRPGFDEAAVFAQYQRLSAGSVALKPASLSLLESAALPQAALTAYQALLAGGKVEGSKILIHGGAGAVGSVAIQIAKILGAREIISTAAAESAASVKEFGADTVIDFQTQDFSELLSDIDIVIDTVGGPVQEKSIAVTKPGGSVVSLVGVMFADLAAEKDVSLELMFHQPSAQQLTWIAQQVDAGKLALQIDSTYAASDIKAALTLVEQGKARGKVILDMSRF
ncbi:NADP-dependent oxidoreductase [Psychromonas ossibalaenae]|uniref:NADP-dependent oxidoreductase n=1 Tax=Psychromonas ossibalaenae TaxID=444922 RepID=UPI00037D2246|nr:NADP-dependent oxidoreductase [Psychromonas ossibalaenae]